MRIYLDDERNPKVEQFDKIVRSYDEFSNFLDESERDITYISFDHDLGLGRNGYDCVKLLVDFDMYYGVLSKDFNFNVHSANPVGAKNIQAYLENYLNARIHDLS